MTGLDRITGKIIADANADAEATAKAADAECKQIAADYAARAEKIRNDMLADAEREASNRVARVKSSAAIEKRNVVLNARCELIDEAFGLALANVKEMSPDKYRSLLLSILSSILINQSRAEENERRDYGGDEIEEADAYEVVLNRADAEAYGNELIDTVKTAVSKKVDESVLNKLKLSENYAPIDGGVILRYGDIEINCSLSMIFSRLRENLETDVYHILFKE